MTEMSQFSQNRTNQAIKVQTTKISRRKSCKKTVVGNYKMIPVHLVIGFGPISMEWGIPGPIFGLIFCHLNLWREKLKKKTPSSDLSHERYFNLNVDSNPFGLLTTRSPTGSMPCQVVKLIWLDYIWLDG